MNGGASTQGRTSIAAFDFDNTLTTRDSVVPFIRQFMGPRSFARVVRNLPGALTSLARRDRDRFREIGTRVVFEGLRYDEVVQAAQQYGEWLVAERLRPDTIELLQEHVRQGHRVVLVSASYADYLSPVADALGVESVLATTLEVEGGVCTGGLVGSNCRGPEKVRRLDTWLAQQGLGRDDVDVDAYGDSSGDREMLAWADRAHWITDASATPPESSATG